MNLQNETDLIAHMFRGEPEPDVMLATVAAKAAFRIEAGGALRPDLEGVEILKEDAEHPLGYFPHDMVLSKPAVDLFVFGKAYAPGGRPVDRMEVAFRFGALERRLAVVGDRTWRTAHEPTAPTPFREMPVTYGNAYGGETEMNGLPVACPDNPFGKGYVLEKDRAVGTPLPNVEAAAQPVKSWQDQPIPAGFAAYPRQTRVTTQRSFRVIDAEKGQFEFTPQVFVSAHPDMTAPQAPPGTECVLTGMTPQGTLRFRVPDLSPVLHLRLGGRTSRYPLMLDTLCLLPEGPRVVLTYRASVRYRAVAEQEREAVLRLGM